MKSLVLQLIPFQPEISSLCYFPLIMSLIPTSILLIEAGGWELFLKSHMSDKVFLICPLQQPFLLFPIWEHLLASVDSLLYTSHKENFAGLVLMRD